MATAVATVAGESTGQLPAGFDAERLHRELEEHGVTVVPGVLTPDQCDTHITALHSWLAQFGTRFPDNINSIIHKYHIGHCRAAWEARLAAKPVFAQVWGTEKLLTSTDGIAIGRPPELGQTAFWTEGDYSGMHHDQGKMRVGLHGYQGALYLEEAQEDDWCFVVLEGSHKFHTEFFDTHQRRKRSSEFRKITTHELMWYQERGCRIRRIACPKGGIILWDSRTVHAGAPPKHDRENPNRWRYIVFICMGPAAWASEEDLEKKRISYNDLRLSRHYPSNGVSLFHHKTGSPFDITELPEAAKTEEAKLLAGVLEYYFDDGQPNGPALPVWQ